MLLELRSKHAWGYSEEGEMLLELRSKHAWGYSEEGGDAARITFKACSGL